MDEGYEIFATLSLDLSDEDLGDIVEDLRGQQAPLLHCIAAAAEALEDRGPGRTEARLFGTSPRPTAGPLTRCSRGP
jgi:hypothetical protein